MTRSDTDTEGRFGSQSIQDLMGRRPIHPFPARMAPGIAFETLSRSRPLRVLDPMSGSGTVLAVARKCGHRTWGFDLDPLAVLLGKTWTSAIDTKSVERRARDVLRRATARYETLGARDAFPTGATRETKEFVRYWFDRKARRQLEALSTCIARLRDPQVRNALWCAFSRLIITKQSGASLAMDLSHSRPHRAFERAPTLPFDGFARAVSSIAENCLDKRDRNIGPASRVNVGDARRLPLRDQSIDLVLTSPPYLNAIDYLRCSKFTLVWMGYSIDELRVIRAGSVGTEVGLPQAEAGIAGQVLRNLRLRPKLSARMESILTRYIDDMRAAMREVRRVLVPGGQATYVVGENTVRGTFVPNSLIVAELAGDLGLEVLSSRSRDLPPNRRYMPPPGARSASMDARMRCEVVMTLQKTGTMPCGAKSSPR